MRNAVFALLVALQLCACAGNGRPAPVKVVLDEDSCVECRMAVSQRPFAAQVAKPGGIADYFDDIGCLVFYARRGIDPGSVPYVVDFESHAWLEAESASYLLAKELPTPMSYGLAAYATPQAAQQATQRWPGRVVNWEQLLQEFNP
jgi:copper chaperone NosL